MLIAEQVGILQCFQITDAIRRAERLLGPDRPVSAMPCPHRLHIGSTPEPLTTAQIEAIG